MSSVGLSCMRVRDPTRCVSLAAVIHASLDAVVSLATPMAMTSAIERELKMDTDLP
jgi:hypothetical protein